MTTWAERAERREDFERDMANSHSARMISDPVYAFIEKHYGEPVDHVGLDEALHELIAAAVAAEREACWKIALDIATKQYDNEQAVQIYDAIRARSGNGAKGE